MLGHLERMDARTECPAEYSIDESIFVPLTFVTYSRHQKNEIRIIEYSIRIRKLSGEQHKMEKISVAFNDLYDL